MQSRPRWWFRASILAIVVMSMGWLSVGVSDVFASPDERANAFFAQTFAENLTFCAQEPLNILAQGLVHPRSTVAPGVCILPASFLGLPLISSFAVMVFSTALFVTPFLAALGIVAWWWTVRRFTQSERMADIAAFVVLIHPAFWYYGARVMMHNVPFVALLMIAGAVGVLASDRRSPWLALAAGVLGGLALTMRLVELPLVFAVSGVLLLVYRREISWRLMVWTALGVSVVLGGYLVLNSWTYGSPFATGYTLPDLRVAPDGGGDVVAPSMIDRALSYLLPFGFYPRAIVKHVLAYGFRLYPILSALSILGAIFAWCTGQKGWRVAVGLLFFASCWLAAVYGSWSVTDNIDPNAMTIGNSHVRYWLPLFVASSAFVAFAVDRWMSRSRGAAMIAIGALLGIMASSAETVFGGTDGLIPTRAALVASEAKREMIVAQTGCDQQEASNVVVIVDHADKLLFPTCRVIVPLRAESTYAIMPTLVDGGLYYFGLTLPEIDVAYLNEVKLKAMDLHIELVETLQDQTLYRIVRNTVE
jgi:4-amino-4-deoxy-L-arabinose transferase-like glycosyltransferase